MAIANSVTNYKSAIIGLDAQFENQYGAQTDIDRVERALYLGRSLSKAAGKEQSDNPLFADDANTWQQAVERMSHANNLNSADINVILVIEGKSEGEASAQVNASDKVIVVNSVANALTQLDLLIKQDQFVALVGLNNTNLAAQEFSENTAATSSKSNSTNNSATISFDESFNGYQPCNGIAALLFAPVNLLESSNELSKHYVYAWLKGFATGSNILTTTQSAFQSAQVCSDEIGLLEVSALAQEKSALTESDDLITGYAGKALNTAISCARSTTGEGAGFSQVLGLLRTVIALQQRYIPAISDWQQPIINDLSQWQSSSFYLPTESRPWYPHQDGSAHVAAYSCLPASGLLANNDYCHIILQENKAALTNGKHSAEDIRDNGFIACSDLQLVLITANDQQGLLAKLIELESQVENESTSNQQFIKQLSLSYFEQSQTSESRYTISLLCESKAELIKEIQAAKLGIPTVFTNESTSKNEWRTPKGSYFTSEPVNANSIDKTLASQDLTSKEVTANNISFLYPGIGATYVGLGRDLFHLFPEIHQDVANLADNIGASLKDTLLNPRTIIRPDFKMLKQLDLNLRGNLADIAEAGVGFACVFTKVFENVFKVKADYATGYSMGEVSMYAALGAWQQPGLMSARLANSETFNQRLCGDLLTLREHWGLPVIAKEESLQQNHSEQESVTLDNELIWETYTIKATLDEVLAASEGEDRVYCTIVNTPDSLLVAGYPEDCLRVIKKLGVRAMPLNMANAIHSSPAKNEYNDMVALYTMDVTSRLKTKMYSSSCYLPVPQLSKAIAHSVAKCLCDRVDFPRLVNTMYDKGARVFIEMGPGRSLCSWVDKTLDFDNSQANKKTDKARVSVPVNAKGTSDELTYLRAIAKLISHGVKLDLHRLFYGSIIVNKA